MLKNIMMSTMTALVCFGQLCSESEGMFSKPKKEAETPAQTYEMQMEEYENKHQKEDYAFNPARAAEGIRVLGPDSFILVSVTLPDSLKRVKKGAFNSCQDLKYVTFGKGLECVSNEAFINCFALKAVTFHNVPAYYGSRVFSNCYRQLKVILDVDDDYNHKSISVTCTNQRELLQKAGITTTSGHFTKHVTPDLNDKNINFCKDLTNLDLHASFVDDVFAACCPKLTIVVINSKTVYPGAFAGCDALETVGVGPRVATLGIYCFFDCSWLKSLNLPGTVKTIGNRAFMNCYNLEDVTMHDGSERIGVDAFCCCSKLAYVRLPQHSLTSIGAGAFAETSLDCVPKSWPLDHIPDACFLGCNLIKSVSTMKFSQIGEQAFKDCKGLQKVLIGPNTKVLDSAFEGCENLKKVQIFGLNVQLGYGSFIHCPSLKIVHLTRAEYAPWFLKNSPSLDDYSCDTVFDTQAQFAAEGQLFTQNPYQEDEEEEIDVD